MNLDNPLVSGPSYGGLPWGGPSIVLLGGLILPFVAWYLVYRIGTFETEQERRAWFFVGALTAMLIMFFVVSFMLLVGKL